MAALQLVVLATLLLGLNSLLRCASIAGVCTKPISGSENARARSSQKLRSPIYSSRGNVDATTPTDKLNFLEADPYFDLSKIPMHLFSSKDPYPGKIVSVKKINGPSAVGDVCEIVVDHGGKMPYYEGQSYGVIPPGINPKNSRPYLNRLYSISSTRYGDDMKGNTATFCVRRAVYYDEVTGQSVPDKKGVCSNYLCDAKPGDEVLLTGPTGKVLLLPESSPEADVIMVATGTGVAPFRAFLRRLFLEPTPAAAHFKGIAWLFLGVMTADSLLYDDEFQQMRRMYPDRLRLDYALSSEQRNRRGGEMFVQDRVEERAEEVFERMQRGAHLYCCGLKGMMPGLMGVLEAESQRRGLAWADTLRDWKAAGRWHVEVY